MTGEGKDIKRRKVRLRDTMGWEDPERTTVCAGREGTAPKAEVPP